MSEKEKMKSKIRKLFNLAESSNSSEAGLALQRATDLMGKWGFDIDDIELSDEKIVLDEIVTDRKQKHDLHGILVSLGEFCAVKVWYEAAVRYIPSSRYTIKIVGYETDIELFKHFFSYLERVFERELETFKNSDDYKFRGNVHGKRVRNSFKVGFTRSISAKLCDAADERGEQKTKTGKELVPVKMGNIDAWFEEELGLKLRRTRTHTRVTTGKGYDAGSTSGSNTSLNAPVNGGSEVKLIGA